MATTFAGPLPIVYAGPLYLPSDQVRGQAFAEYALVPKGYIRPSTNNAHDLLALPALLPVPGSGRAAQAALPFCCLRKASARLANSCGATSSLWVAINQLLPDGSFTAPPRSP